MLQNSVCYTRAQKNIGPSGLAIIVIKNLLKEKDSLPAMMQYKTYADSDSMYNTPPTFAWYLSGMVFKWLKEWGLSNQKNVNESANKLLLHRSSDFYKNDVDKESRSNECSISFGDDSLNNKF